MSGLTGQQTAMRSSVRVTSGVARHLDPGPTGTVVGPDDDNWAAARAAWVAQADQQPAAVALVRSAEDIAAVVRTAARLGLQVMAQGTGHGALPVGSLHDTVLVRTAALNKVKVDSTARAVWCGSGVVWQPVSDEAGKHGLAVQAGSAPDVGVAGYLLSGGLSWLARLYGLAVNDVIRLEVVLADGTLRRVDDDHEPDLFWALRGGGGSFGIVTGVGIRLHQLAEVTAGTLFFPIAQASDVLHTWRGWTKTVSECTMSCGRLLQFPPLPDLPRMLRGQAFAAIGIAHQGSRKELDAAITSLRRLQPSIDTLTEMPASQLSTLHMDPPGPTPVRAHGLLLRELPETAIDSFVACAGDGSGSPLVSVDLRHLGGAVARRPRHAGALGHFDAGFTLQAVGVTPDPATEAKVEAHALLVQHTMAPWAADLHYANFDEVAAGGRARFHDPATLNRLRSIKDHVDPDNLFTCGHPVLDHD